MLRCLTVAIALISSGPALASGGDTGAANAQSPKASAAREKKICRSDRSVGTILPQRVCHTAAEWQAIEANAAVSRDHLLNEQDARQRMQREPN